MDFSNESELLLVTGFSSLSLLAYKSFPVKNIFFDFVFWVLPHYLIIVYPEYKWSYIGFFASCIDFRHTKPNLKHCLKEYDIPTWLRSNVSLMVAVSIFAVDFSFFPKRFGKSNYYGYKFMDIGVGSFVYNAGVMSVKFCWVKNLKSIVILFILGVLRLLCVHFFRLDVNIREYGKHMNFYFLLAICNLIYGFIRNDFDFLIGYITIIAYEHLLKNFGLAKYILSDGPRLGFIEQNKEGILNIVSYLSIFLMANLCGRIYFSKYSWKKKIFNISLFTAVFYSSYKTHLKYQEPSRRCGNATYVFWILFLHTFHILIYYTLTLISGSMVTPTQLNISKSMLFNFLLTNLQVLMYKKLFYLENFGEFYGNLMIISYLAISFAFPVFLSRVLFNYMSRNNFNSLKNNKAV